MKKSVRRIAIQGEAASFHEIAARLYFGEPIELMYCVSFADTFEVLSRGNVDTILVAVRNSNHGAIDEVSALIAGYQALIDGEYTLPIHQHLIGYADTDMTHIRTVISHPVALSQCSNYIARVLGDASIHPYHDTAAAVQYVKASNRRDMVAIASAAAAELYGLPILVKNIENDHDNATTFAAISVLATRTTEVPVTESTGSLRLSGETTNETRR